MPWLEFSLDRLQQYLSDPYAVLGISLAVDKQQIQKRYPQVAKLLHHLR